MTKQEYERQQAEKRLHDGIEVYNAGTLDTAADAFGDAERRFRILGDVKRVCSATIILATGCALSAKQTYRLSRKKRSHGKRDVERFNVNV